jgi:probable phosphoglycerate mutase
MTDAAGLLARLYLVRHGETAWSLSGQHTGRTDIPLIEQGEEDARKLAERLHRVTFSRVFTSPLRRARRTCELAGLDEFAEIEPDLAEWDYGEYEGRRLVEIRDGRPGWMLFRDGCPGGESPAQVCERADRLIARLRKMGGSIFSSAPLRSAFSAMVMNSPRKPPSCCGTPPRTTSRLRAPARPPMRVEPIGACDSRLDHRG